MRAAGHTMANDTAATAVTTNSSGIPTELFIGSYLYNAAPVDTELRFLRLFGALLRLRGPGALEIAAQATLACGRRALLTCAAMMTGYRVGEAEKACLRLGTSPDVDWKAAQVCGWRVTRRFRPRVRH
jgi:hypothetical protein